MFMLFNIIYITYEFYFYYPKYYFKFMSFKKNDDIIIKFIFLLFLIEVYIFLNIKISNNIFKVTIIINVKNFLA